MEDKEWNVTDPDAFWKEFFSQPFKGVIESLTINFENSQRKLGYSIPVTGALEEILHSLDSQLTHVFLYPNYSMQISELSDVRKLYMIMKENGFDLIRFFTYFDPGMDYLTLITYGDKCLSQTQTNFGRKSKITISSDDKRPTIEEYLSSCPFLEEK